MTSAYTIATLKPDGTYSIRIYSERNPTSELNEGLPVLLSEHVGHSFSDALCKATRDHAVWHPFIAERIE